MSVPRVQADSMSQKHQRQSLRTPQQFMPLKTEDRQKNRRSSKSFVVFDSSEMETPRSNIQAFLSVTDTGQRIGTPSQRLSARRSRNESDTGEGGTGSAFKVPRVRELAFEATHRPRISSPGAGLTPRTNIWNLLRMDLERPLAERTVDLNRPSLSSLQGFSPKHVSGQRVSVPLEDASPSTYTRSESTGVTPSKNKARQKSARRSFHLNVSSMRKEEHGAQTSPLSIADGHMEEFTDQHAEDAAYHADHGFRQGTKEVVVSRRRSSRFSLPHELGVEQTSLIVGGATDVIATQELLGVQTREAYPTLEVMNSARKSSVSVNAVSLGEGLELEATPPLYEDGLGDVVERDLHNRDPRGGSSLTVRDEADEEDRELTEEEMRNGDGGGDIGAQTEDDNDNQGDYGYRRQIGKNGDEYRGQIANDGSEYRDQIDDRDEVDGQLEEDAYREQREAKKYRGSPESPSSESAAEFPTHESVRKRSGDVQETSPGNSGQEDSNYAERQHRDGSYLEFLPQQSRDKGESVVRRHAESLDPDGSVKNFWHHKEQETPAVVDPVNVYELSEDSNSSRLEVSSVGRKRKTSGAASSGSRSRSRGQSSASLNPSSANRKQLTYSEWKAKAAFGGAPVTPFISNSTMGSHLRSSTPINRTKQFLHSTKIQKSVTDFFPGDSGATPFTSDRVEEDPFPDISPIRQPAASTSKVAQSSLREGVDKTSSQQNRKENFTAEKTSSSHPVFPDLQKTSHRASKSATNEVDEEDHRLDEEESSFPSLDVANIDLRARVMPSSVQRPVNVATSVRPGVEKKAQTVRKPAPVKKSGVSKQSNKVRDTTLSRSTVKYFAELYSSMKLSKDAIDEIVKVSEKFWNNNFKALEAYALHAKRKEVTDADVILLMKRQRLITNTEDLHDKIRQMLPLELRRDLIPCAYSNTQRKK